MRIRTSGAVVAAALALAACGSAGGKAASQPRPPTPINLTVYVDDSSVSVSPSRVGAGPVVFIVTNQASQSEALNISRAGRGIPIATTAPINPQGTTQLAVNVRPGAYTIATAARGRTEAQLTQVSPIRSTTIHIGRQRQSSSGVLLQP
jgi:hypothetical protein